MVKVGLVGEDPNDTSSIKNLLAKRYNDRIHFVPLLQGTTGTGLDTLKFRKALIVEFKRKQCAFAICIRDLDALKSQTDQLKKRVQWFNNLNESINNQGVLLLNIWELEALVFGDIETFNKIHKINHKSNKDPMFIQEPKEELKKITRKSQNPYKESHCPDLFKQLNIDKIEAKCSCFKEFIKELEGRLN
ncbi:DUF4276 family protein [Mucilaginibacter psychrotolerans]|uniref:DUF4276 family protein n=1 Tax=Mucilaginibacter psychrotolerans TaxID=1524096 RepID=A0A4Y8SNE0_9SPHI|nr:DUF4276 family protein [Mucilaginibacter psychrotolerans]TFF40388.1 DUF4276 family protein [Mucilaginibacter psychrotolerans]